MKRNPLFSLFLTVLLVASLVLSLMGVVTLKQNTIVRTGGNNTRFTLGADIDFLRTEVNATHLWLDQSYTTGFYTRYCIFVYSPSNANLTVNSWFNTANSSGSLTVSVPASTDINLGFHSPNLVSAWVSGAVTSTWHSGNQTLTMTVNTDTSATFTINVVVNQTQETNITPENVRVRITDMDATNWVLSETQYYTFQARYWDGDGTTDLTLMKIAFTDSQTWVNASYNQVTDEFMLDSGEEVVNLQAGTVTALDINMLQVNFQLYFTTQIVDVENVDIYMYCIDVRGAYDGWELRETDYFNIYNLGGSVTYTVHQHVAPVGPNLTAGRIPNYDWNNLYAEKDTWAKASIVFRNLVYVDAIFGIDCFGGAVPNLDDYPVTSDENDDMCKEGYFYFGLDYMVDGSWVDGWYVRLELLDVDRGGGWPISTPANWAVFNATWWYQNTLITYDYLACWYEGLEVTDFRDTQRIHVRLWFNKANASSVFGGWVSPVFYGWTPTGNWVLSGSAGPKTDAQNAANGTAKDSFLFSDLKDADGNIIQSTEIDFVRFWLRVERPSSVEDYLYAIKVTDMLNFQVEKNMWGVDTPSPIEPTLPTEAQGGGMFAWLGSVFGDFSKVISDALGPAVLELWNVFVGFMDTVFTTIGWPNGFSQIGDWILSISVWIGDSFTYLISLLTSAFTFIGAIIGKLLNTLSIVVAQWVSIIQSIFSMLGGGLGTGINIWESLNLATWVILGAILYPIFLYALWDEKGIDAVLRHINLVTNVFAWLGRIFLTVIQVFINIISTIIESIPVVE